MKRNSRYLLLLAAAVLLSLGGTGCGQRDEQLPEREPVSYREQKTETVSAYERLLRAITNYEDVITLRGISEEEMETGYRLVRAEHPEIFWVGSSYEWTSYTGGDDRIELRLQFIYPMGEIIERQEQLTDAMYTLLDSLRDDMTDYEKALFLHDCLVESVSYDEEAFEYHNAHPDETLREESYTAYGALVEHRAVCSGYSKAYQLLLRELGIECGRVSGRGRNGNHEWNYLVLDGEYYYVDVTWDDPVTEGAGDNDTLSHEYFCITTDEILADHSIDGDNAFVPSCTATRYEYYRYHGLYLDAYSADAMDQLLRERMGAGELSLRFATADALNEALYWLFEKNEIFELPSVQGHYSHVSYSYGEKMLTIRLS